jgi:hypothetical protein
MTSRFALVSSITALSIDRAAVGADLIRNEAMTLSPATGTLRFGHVSGSDHRLAAGDFSILGMNDSRCADDQKCGKERYNKERVIQLFHDYQAPLFLR